MFFGQSNQKLDAKSRMTIPSQHRRHLEDGMMVTRSIREKCLQLYPISEWQIRAEKIEALERVDPRARQLRRQFFSQAEPVDMDKQGRILINQRLRSFAGIGSEVVVAGNNSYLELWSVTEWDNVNIDELDEDALREVAQHILDVF